jgi:hypothetical protein
MLSEALQRNAKREARLSNISDYFLRFSSRDCGIRMTIEDARLPHTLEACATLNLIYSTP